MNSNAQHRQAQPQPPPAGPAEAHYTRIARATATLQLVTPAGYPAALTVSAATLPEELAALLVIADLAAQQAQAAGWTPPAEDDPEPATTATHGSEPTFCGYVCSRTFEPASGQPAWIIVDGHQAHRREKQGDTWYSYQGEPGTYTRALVIRKGEVAPGIVWPAGQEPKK